MFNIFSTKKLLVIILLFSLITRLFRLDYPKAYVFDEVYHAFTAKEYLKGSKAAWEWWTTPPPGVAYEWTHPPLAKEIMTASMWLFHNNGSFFWRLPGAILGVISIWLVFLISKKLFDEPTALIASFIFSLDGLNFVQSRTGMNDIYQVAFSLASLYFFLDKRLTLAGIFLGLSITSKWSGVYMFLLLFILVLRERRFKDFLPLIYIPPIIYLFFYLPFFILGHSWDQFIELQRQMYYYHTHLKATHDYASPWWSWPFNLYPVWYFVEYGNGKVANIFASGNPLIFWSGTAAIIIAFWEMIKKRATSLIVVVGGFLVFWLPWSISPRIMFLYHFSPSVPFLSMALSYQLSPLIKQNRTLLFIILAAFLVSFLLFYPMLSGVMLPKDVMQLFFRTNLTKNPFR